MKKRHVAASAEALADLQDIFAYLAKDNPRLASRAVEQLEEAMLDLRETALQYQVVIERPDAPVRRRVVGSYNVLFWVTDDTVGVLRILHGKRRITLDWDVD